MIAIIDYDAGNLKSVEKALLHLGEDAVISDSSWSWCVRRCNGKIT